MTIKGNVVTYCDGIGIVPSVDVLVANNTVMECRAAIGLAPRRRRKVR